MIVRRQRILYSLPSRIVRGIRRRGLRQSNQHLVRRMAARIANSLDPKIPDASLIHCCADMVFIGCLGKGHSNLRSALEVHTQRNMMPKQDAKQSGDRKNQRKPEEVPLLPEPVDIRATKQFHAKPSADAFKAPQSLKN